MTPEQFTYWLQGFFELSETTQFSPKQVQMVKDHLNLVFVKKTPVPTNPEVNINKAYEGFRKQPKQPWQDKDFNEAVKDFEEFTKPRIYCSTGITASGSNDDLITQNTNNLISPCSFNPKFQYPQTGVSCGLGMPSLQTKQSDCSICKRLGHACAGCATFGNKEPTFVNTTGKPWIAAGVLPSINGFYRCGFEFNAFDDEHGSHTTSVKINPNDTFLLIELRPVYYGEPRPSYIAHIFCKNKDLYTEFNEKELDNWGVSYDHPQISELQRQRLSLA